MEAMVEKHCSLKGTKGARLMIPYFTRDMHSLWESLFAFIIGHSDIRYRDTLKTCKVLTEISESFILEIGSWIQSHSLSIEA